MVPTIRKLAAIAALGMALTACALPPLPSASPTPTSTPIIAPVETPTLTPTLTPTPVETPTPAAPAVVMNDDGTGSISLGMTVDQFHQKATGLGWDCNPATGTNSNDGVTAGGVYIRFWGGKLFSLGVSDTSYQTEKGLAVGDTVDQLTGLYGTKFDKTSDSGSLTYFFTLPPKNNVLSVGIDQASLTVSSWGLSIPGSGPNG